MNYLKKSFSVAYMGKTYSDSWERIFGKEFIRKYNGAKLKIKRTYCGSSEHRFYVELIKGKWPFDNDLITLCDGDTPPTCNHFGGYVHKSPDEKSAEVSVYVDFETPMFFD
jgi:hypothetical protein